MSRPKLVSFSIILNSSKSFQSWESKPALKSLEIEVKNYGERFPKKLKHLSVLSLKKFYKAFFRRNFDAKLSNFGGIISLVLGTW